MGGIMENLLVAIENLNANVVLLTDATRGLSAIQMNGRHDRPSKICLKEGQDMARIFDELFEEDPYSEVTSAEITSHLKDCEDDEVCRLIKQYDLENPRSRGRHIFINYARTRAIRERLLRGHRILVGISMKTTN